MPIETGNVTDAALMRTLRDATPWEDLVRTQRTVTFALLERLLIDRAGSEARLAEHHRQDPLTTTTGRSLFDRLVDETQLQLLELDAIVDEFDARRPVPEIVIKNGTGIPGARRVTQSIAQA